jgi:oxaloacetate decarboxylase beta subunit
VLDNLMAQLAASGSEAVGTLSNQLDALVTAEQYLASYGMTLSNVTVSVGLIDVLYLGIKLGIYPCLIFLGVGAMTDFGPLIANPKSLLLGAAAQLGIFITFVGCRLMGFTGPESSAIGIIGGADGPTAIFVTSRYNAQALWGLAVKVFSNVLVIVLNYVFSKLIIFKNRK